MKAVGYFREAEAGGPSLAEQNRAFLDFCDREGLEVAGTFADDAGANGRAPGFRQVVSLLRASGADDALVVVTDVRALGRDLRDAAVHLFQVEGLGARVTTVTDGGDVEAALMTAWTSDDGGGRLSHRVRAAMRKKAVKGEVLGRPPYGYKVGARRRLELVPDEAVVVRYIFRLYLHEQLGIRLIARRLNEEGIKTRRGGNWSMVSIRDILRNRAYLGTYARFEVRVTGTHPALVQPEDYHAVQDRLNARRTSGAPRVAMPFLLSGLAYCGHCGNKLIGVSRKQSWKRRDGERVSNSYRYYQCESRTNQSICAYHTRRAGDLEEIVRSEIERQLEGDTATAPGRETDAAHREADVERLRSRLRSLDRRLEGYIDAAARGRLRKDRMRELSLRVATERLAAEDQLEAVELRIARSAAGSEGELQRAARSLLESWTASAFGEQQAALRDVVSRIDVSDDAVGVQLRA